MLVRLRNTSKLPLMDEQITLLLTRFLNNERLPLHELQRLRDWLNRPENQFSVREWMHEVWVAADEVESSLGFDALIADVNRLSGPAKPAANEPKRVWQMVQRAAAILILPLLMVGGYYFWRTAEAENPLAEIIVPSGQKSEVILPDSTHIWLNSGSRLKYPVRFTAKTDREVFLEGEAYFEVARRNRSRFIVRLERSAVEVLGTKFNVKAYVEDRQIETSLFHGKVSFVANDGAENPVSELMAPGEKINFNLNTNRIQKVKFGAEDLLGWKSNRLVFADDNFDAVVRKIERWYNVRVSYRPEQFVGQRLTLALGEGESIEQLLQIMQKVMHIRYEINSKQIDIKPN